MKLKRGGIFLLLVLALGLGGCATERAAVGDYFSDAGVTTRVKKAIYDEPTLKVTDVSVTTEDGVVRLEGKVKSRAEAVKAAQVARSVKGVKQVKNDLKVQ